MLNQTKNVFYYLFTLAGICVIFLFFLIYPRSRKKYCTRTVCTTAQYERQMKTDENNIKKKKKQI